MATCDAAAELGRRAGERAVKSSESAGADLRGAGLGAALETELGDSCGRAPTGRRGLPAARDAFEGAAAGAVVRAVRSPNSTERAGRPPRLPRGSPACRSSGRRLPRRMMPSPMPRAAKAACAGAQCRRPWRRRPPPRRQGSARPRPAVSLIVATAVEAGRGRTQGPSPDRPPDDALKREERPASPAPGEAGRSSRFDASAGRPSGLPCARPRRPRPAVASIRVPWRRTRPLAASCGLDRRHQACALPPARRTQLATEAADRRLVRHRRPLDAAGRAQPAEAEAGPPAPPRVRDRTARTTAPAAAPAASRAWASPGGRSVPPASRRAPSPPPASLSTTKMRRASALATLWTQPMFTLARLGQAHACRCLTSHHHAPPNPVHARINSFASPRSFSQRSL